MTISEFKAWLEGFESAMDGPPNADQWAKIKAKLARVSETTEVKYPLLRDHGPRWDAPIIPPPIATTRADAATMALKARANG